jgi:hypothetical protein
MFTERPLTESERLLLPPPLASAIDLDAVRIARRWHTPIAALLKVTVVRGWRIFWKNAPVEARSVSERAHLAHELVHVWQYKAMRRTGLELLANRRYRYDLDPARTFISYGYEQQASIVEDYVRLSSSESLRRERKAAPPLEHYERVIASASGVRS